MDISTMSELSEISKNQYALWIDYQRHPNALTNYAQLCYQLSGPLSVLSFNQSVSQVLSSYEFFKTKFIKKGHRIHKQILHHKNPIPEFVTLKEGENLGKSDIKKSISDIMERVFSESIDFLSYPNYRIVLLQETESQHYFIVSVPHLLLDGFSANILLKKISTLYNNERSHFTLEKREQSDSHYSELETESCLYWKEKIQHSTSVLDFRQSPSEVKAEERRSNRQYLILEKEYLRALKKYAFESKSTVFLTLLSLVALLLYKFSHQEQFSLLYAVNLRKRDERQRLGFFVNLLPLSIKINKAASFFELMDQVKIQRRSDKRYQDIPYYKILSLLSKNENSSSRYNLLFSQTKYSPSEFSLENISTEFFPYPIKKTTLFDLSFLYDYDDHQIIFSIDYCVEKYEDWFVQEILHYLQHLIKEINVVNQWSIQSVPYFTSTRSKEQDRFTGAHLKKTTFSLQALFQNSVDQHPHLIAASDGKVSLTYKELDQLSNQKAQFLSDLGLKVQTRCALLLPKDVKILPVMLALIKLRITYVPLEPSYPSSFVAEILNDSEINSVIYFSEVKPPVLLDRTIYWIQLNELEEGSKFFPVTFCGEKESEEDIVYIIYSSGTTGKPKGVPIKQKNITRLFTLTDSLFEFDSNDLWSVLHSFVFDFSFWELWGAWAHGATALLVPPEQAKSPQYLYRFIKDHKVTVFNVTPSYFKSLLHEEKKSTEKIDSLRYVIFGAEKLLPMDLLFWVKKYGLEIPQLINMYGLTEAAVHAAYHRIGPEDLKTPKSPIGQPFGDTRGYLLNSSQQVVPPGVVGEICLSGPGVTPGYINRPEMNSEKFVFLSFAKDFPFPFYCTGDLARSDRQGNWEYIGRKDQQIKFRGYRIELEAVEIVLKQLSGIQEAVVLLVTEIDEPQLIGFYKASSEETFSSATLAYELKQRLPRYMVPTQFLPVSVIPLTLQGKTDNKKLIEVYKQSLHLSQEVISVDSLFSVMRNIELIWKRVLHTDSPFSWDIPFFSAGGGSIDLLALHSELERFFSQTFPFNQLFDFVTIREQAEYLSTLLTHENFKKEDSSKRKLVPKPSILKGRSSSSSGSSSDELIAVIGMSGCFPGAVDLASFWQQLCLGKEGISFFDTDILIKEGVSESLLKEKNYIRAKGFLENADQFDSSFFNINESDAMLIDPQHRLFLETCWLALEDSGYISEKEAGKIGVFAGATNLRTYLSTYLNSNDKLVHQFGEYALHINNALDFLSTRVSFKLNLTGPSMTVQTGCSTSLVSVCSAVRSLLARECDLALAGGVSLTMPLKSGYPFQPGLIFSPDGHCRTFDAKAQGTVPGNGIGVVVLKRFTEAQSAGDPIDAIIRGYAINNDGGHKLGMTTPCQQAQEELIQSALVSAGVCPNEIDYIEAHGTGTVQGDRIELSALNTLFAGSRRDRPCYIGSVKTNIGHLDAAAGVAGLIKTILCLKNKKLVPSLHFETPNPIIDFSQVPFSVVTDCQEWESNQKTRKAGVSALAVGGTNVHLIVEEYCDSKNEITIPWDGLSILGVSAKTPTALSKQIKQILDYLETSKESFVSVTYTLHVGRCHFPYRLSKVVSNKQEAIHELKTTLLENKNFESYKTKAKNLCFFFSNTGQIHSEELCNLQKLYPVFRKTLENCYKEIDLLYSIKLHNDCKNNKFSNSSSCKVTLIPQLLLFSVQYALSYQWFAWGLTPQCLLGIKNGEYVAACLSGVLSLTDALTLVGLQVKWHDSSLNKEKLAEKINLLTFCSKLSIPVLSSLTQDWMTSEQASSPDYWIKHITSEQALESNFRVILTDKEDWCFFNLNIFQSGYPSVFSAKDILNIEFIGRVGNQEKKDQSLFLEPLISQLWQEGFSINWQNYYQNRPVRRVHLPGYLFERVRYWPDYNKNIQEQVVDSKPETVYCYRRSWHYDNVTTSLESDLPLRETVTVLFCDQQGLARQLKTSVFNCSQKLYTVQYGDQYELSGNHFTINPNCFDDYKLLFKSISMHDFDKANVIYCWALTKEEKEVSQINELDQQFSFSCFVKIIQSSLVELKQNCFIALKVLVNYFWLISFGDTIQPIKHTLLGPALTINRESDQMKCTLIDVGVPFSEENYLESRVLNLLSEDLQHFKEPLLAYRYGMRCLASFEKIPSKDHFVSLPVRAGGVYLITGGLGEIGLTFAEYLAQQHSVHLVLLQRSPFPDSSRWQDKQFIESLTPQQFSILQRLNRLRETGSQVYVMQCDVASETQLRQRIHTILEKIGALNGVIHAAGVGGGGLIRHINTAQVAELFASKIQGTLILHQCLDAVGAELDFMLLCSALSAIVGYPSQSVYNSASAFLDAFSYWRNAYYGRTLSINWDTWSSGGMAVRETQLFQKSLRKSLLSTGFSRKAGTAVIDQCAGLTDSQVIASTLPIQQRLTQDVLKEDVTFFQFSNSLLSPLQSKEQKAESIHSWLRSLWKTHLGLTNLLSADDFFNLGGDSLAAVHLIAIINRFLPIKLAPDALLRVPQFGPFVDYVVSKFSEDHSKEDTLDFDSALTLIKAGKAPHTLFLIHPVGGTTYIYRSLCEALQSDISVVGLNSEGAEISKSNHLDVVRLSHQYVDIIRQYQGKGPYFLGGLSFGGLLAYEIAQQIACFGERVPLVILFDTPGFEFMPKKLDKDSDILVYLLEVGAQVEFDKEKFYSLPFEDQIRYFYNKAGKLLPSHHKTIQNTMKHYLTLYKQHMEAQFNYVPQPAEKGIEQVYYFAAKDSDAVNPVYPEKGWQRLLKERCRLFEAEGNHITLLLPSNVGQIARIVDGFFQKDK